MTDWAAITASPAPRRRGRSRDRPAPPLLGILGGIALAGGALVALGGCGGVLLLALIGMSLFGGLVGIVTAKNGER